MATYQRIMRKARAFVGVRNRMRQRVENPAYWKMRDYMQLFNCFFNSPNVQLKQGPYRAHNIRSMRQWRLAGALNYAR